MSDTHFLIFISNTHALPSYTAPMSIIHAQYSYPKEILITMSNNHHITHVSALILSFVVMFMPLVIGTLIRLDHHMGGDSGHVYVV